jgi:hypothetical protein
LRSGLLSHITKLSAAKAAIVATIAIHLSAIHLIIVAVAEREALLGYSHYATDGSGLSGVYVGWPCIRGVDLAAR